MVDVTLRLSSIVATTKDRWDFQPYSLQERGPCNVPPQYRKNTFWGYDSETESSGYYARIAEEYRQEGDPDRAWCLEFNAEYICWCEAEFIPAATNRQRSYWRVHRTARTDLGCDILISETPAGEYRERSPSSHTPRTPRSPITKADSEAEEPEAITVHPPNTEEEERIAQLAESIPLPSQEPTIMATQTITQPSLADYAQAQIRRASANEAGPSTTRNVTIPPGVVFGRPVPGGGPPGPSGGGPPGPTGGGPPGQPPGGPFGGPPNPPGGPPGIPPMFAGAPVTDKLVGNAPTIFQGDRTKAEDFLSQWNLYNGINYANSIMINPYQRTMLFLSYIQGPLVGEWVRGQHAWLNHQIVAGRLPVEESLWRTVLRNFRENFANILEREVAEARLREGIKMKEGKIDNYIAEFEQLVRHAGYNPDDPQTLYRFTSGLPYQLYSKVYEHDRPNTYKDWKHHARERHRDWVHTQAHAGAPRRGVINPSRFQNNWSTRPSFPPRFNNRDPNAMDTSPGRIRARTGTAEENKDAHGYLAGAEHVLQKDAADKAEGRGHYAECFRCHKKGHFSRECPQQPWNQPRGGGSNYRGNNRGNTFRGRGNYHGNNYQGGQSRSYNTRRGEVEEDEPGHEEAHIARAVADDRTDQQRAEDWLKGAGQEKDAVKDLIIQALWKREDFRDA